MVLYDDLIKVSKQLMFREPFYGLLLISLTKEFNDSIPTACVSKQDINLKLTVNSKFWGDLDDKTKLGILKHELLHIGFFHFNLVDSFPNKKLLNVAADLEVNQYIQEEFKGEKWGGLELDGEEFKNLNLERKKGTKYYYEALQKEMEQNPGSKTSQALNDMMEGGDIHELWEQFEELTEAEKKLISKQVDHTLKEIAKEIKKSNPGSIPGELKSYIDKLFEVTNPVLNWKEYLRRFSGSSVKIQTRKTRYKPNVRFKNNPALKITPRKNTLVAIDTSGSVSENDLIEFFNEIHHIHKTGVEITIVECDTKIQRIYEYKGKRDKIEVQGRGGTSFEPVFDYVKNEKKFNNLIYLTDGEAFPPSTKLLIPVLWVHCSNCTINKNLPGSKIQITKK